MLIPVVALLLSAPGCGKSKKHVERGGGGDEVIPDEGSNQTAAPTKKEFTFAEFGSLEGLITYEGTPPTPGSLKPEMEKHKDKDHCIMDAKPEELIEQTWVIDGPNHGVANVCIFLKAPEGQYFKIDDKDKKLSTVVKLRQPRCAFLPHVLDLYPYYFDGQKYQETGQTFQAVNDAAMPHNTKIARGPKNGGFDQILPPQTSTKAMKLNPQPTPLGVNCSYHTWMTAFLWVFDHPYHAVSRGEYENDKTEDFGKFKIDRVPAGVDVTIYAWHNGTGQDGYVLGGRAGKKVQFKKGANKMTLKLPSGAMELN
jgi:hypothetical protein